MLLAKFTIFLRTNLCIINTVFSFINFVYVYFDYLVKGLTKND